MIERIGVYAIERELGRGGMGVVYAGRAPTGDPVAIKVLLEAETDVEVRRRFETEIAACARLLHPNVVRLLDAGRAQGRPFLVMELLDGVTLAERIQGQGPLPVLEAVALVAELANGLDVVHASGIQHRDLKPSNVMLCPDRPVITDFGLARDPAQERERITVTGEMLGTPAYMAPEQAMAAKEALGPATDVYGLGTVLYHALTGRPPFLGTQLQLLLQVVENTPTRPSQLRADVDARLDAIVLRCLAKRPEDRFPSAGALAEALNDYALERGSSPGTTHLKLAAILTLGLAVGAVGVWRSTTGEPTPARATPVASIDDALPAPRTTPTPATTSSASPTPSPTASPPPTILARATRAFQARRREEALVLLKAIPSDRWRAETWVLCGRIHAVTAAVRWDPKSRELAIKAFRKALALDPGSLEALQNLALFGTSLSQTHGEVERVEAQIRQRAGRTPIGIAIAGRSILRKVNRIENPLELWNTVELALSTFDQALDQDPSCQEAWAGRLAALDALALAGQRVRSLGPEAPPRASTRAITARITKAIDGLQQGLSGPGADARVFCQAASLLRRHARRADVQALLPRAVALADQAIQLEPRFGQAYLERALARWWLQPGTRAARGQASPEVLEDLQHACAYGPSALTFEELAQARSGRGERQATEAALTRAIELTPPGRDPSRLHLRRATCRANLGQPARALQDLTLGWSALTPSEARHWTRQRAKLKVRALALEEARALLADRKWDEALARLQREESRSPGAWLLRGRILADRRQYLANPKDEAQAILSFKTILEQLATDHREAHVQLALLQPDHAPTALKMAEGGTPQQVALAWVAAARRLYLAQRVDTEKFKRAYAHVIKALQLDPGCVEAWTDLLQLFAIVFSGGSLSQELTRDWAWARGKLRAPGLVDAPRVQAMLGYTLQRSPRSGATLRTAERLLTRAIELEPRLAFAWRVRGQLRIKRRTYPGGLSDLKEAARLSPWKPEILEDLGQGYLQSGALEQADVVLTRVIQAAPRRARAYSLRSAVRRRQGRPTEATADQAKARSLSGRRP